MNFVVSLLNNKNKYCGCITIEVSNDYKNCKVMKFMVPQDTMKLRATKFVNAKVKASGELTGINGAIERYSTFNIDTKTVDNESLVVLCRTEKDGKKGFAMANYEGKIAFLDEKQAVAQIEKRKGNGSGIANGKLVDKGNGKFLSAITGDYDFIQEVGIIGTKAKEEKKTPDVLVDVWDLSDNTKTIEEHIKAVADQPDKLKGKITKKKIFDLLQKCKPEGLDVLVESENWKEIIASFVKNLGPYQEVFDNSEVPFDKIKNILKQINVDSAKVPDFKAQIMKAKEDGVTFEDVVF